MLYPQFRILERLDHLRSELRRYRLDNETIEVILNQYTQGLLSNPDQEFKIQSTQYPTSFVNRCRELGMEVDVEAFNVDNRTYRLAVINGLLLIYLYLPSKYLLDSLRELVEYLPDEGFNQSM